MSPADSADAPVPAKKTRLAKWKVELTAEQRRRQDALDRSWEAAQNDLADPAFVELLNESLARTRINASESTETPTATEFLARTEPGSGNEQVQP